MQRINKGLVVLFWDPIAIATGPLRNRSWTPGLTHGTSKPQRVSIMFPNDDDMFSGLPTPCSDIQMV